MLSNLKWSQVTENHMSQQTNNERRLCYVMAPTLFSMMFSAMLTDVFQDVDAGFPTSTLGWQVTEPRKATSQIQGADRCG